MSRTRSRRLAPALLMAVASLALVACGQDYPNSTFTRLTDLNSAIDSLWNRLLFLGTVVFIITEALLIITIIKFRKRPGGPAAKQIHGNAALEITWTVIPALILVLIAVPTVKTIFKTQAKAPAGALEVQVIGHQWWWEFRYPELGITTANEVYIPAGRAVNFALQTKDVLHSFWTPQLGGKRDLITNKTNYLWFTPDASLTEQVYNGFCTEYCGSSHANMRFRVYTVSADKFDSWAAHQKTAAVTATPAPAAAPTVATASLVGGKTAVPAAPVAAPSTGYSFPVEKLPAHVIPKTTYTTVPFDDALLASADVARGRELVTNPANMGKAPCLTCHVVKGEGVMNMTDDNAVGPNLTHFATRHTFGGGLFPNDPKALARWIKNSRTLKPGSLMPVLGNGEFNPASKSKNTAGLDDRQIADIVAYLLALK